MKILTTIDTIPVSASYKGDSNILFKGNVEKIETNDGYPLYKSTLMDSLIDVKGNKHSFLGLTDSKNTTELLSDRLKVIETIGPIAISDANTLSSILGVDSNYNLILTDITEPDALLFTLDYEETIGSNFYYSFRYRNTAITIDPTDDSTIVYETFRGDDTQIFTPIPVSSGQGVMFLAKDGRNFKYNDDPVFHFHTSVGGAVDSRVLTSEFKGYETVDTWIRYNNFYAPEYSTELSQLTVNLGESISDIETNFIVTAPYDDITVHGNSATIELDILPTKNFKTIGSELSLIPTSGVSGADLVDFRDYNRIYTGGNQIEGYSNINLGYTSAYSSVLKFKSDAFTYFHIPITATEVSIQDSGLAFAGAFAGNIPEFSDRIYKRLANYEDMVWWGGGSHNGIQDGTWLCAWLSAGEVLMDFNGVDSYAVVDDGLDRFNFRSADFTIEGESDLTNTGVRRALISKFSWGDNKRLLRLMVHTSGILALNTSSDGINETAAMVAFADVPQTMTRWKVVKSGTTVKFYFNNILAASTGSAVATIKSDNTQVLIGAVSNDYTTSPESKTEFWDRAINWIKVTSKVDSGHWRMNDAYNYTLPDSSGNRNDTTLINMDSVGDTSTWIERYYNPGVIDADTALLEPSNGIDSFVFTPNPNPVVDVISNMVIEAGAYYKYYHVGNGGFNKLLESQKGITNDRLIVQLSDFTTGAIVNDESKNNNDGIISNYDNADEVTLDIGFGTEEQSAILLNGNSEVRVNSSPTLNVRDSKSITAWIYSRNWENGRSATLFSNYYKGGDKFEYINHGLYYSYIVPNAIEDDERFTVVPSEITDGDDLINVGRIGGVPISVGVDQDGFHWVAAYRTYVQDYDGAIIKETQLLKLTSSGSVLESVNFEGFEVVQLLIQDDNIGYLIDVDGNIKTFNLHTIDIISDTTTTAGEFMYIDMANALTGLADTRDMDIFNDGTICRIGNDGKFYLGNQITGSAPFAGRTYKHVCCDDDSYYFITTTGYGVNPSDRNLKLHMYSKDNRAITQSFTMDYTTQSSANPLNIPFITKESVDGVVKTVIYWVSGSLINRYYIADDGEMILLTSMINSNALNGTINGDCSGYKMNKRTYINNNGNPYVKYSVLLDNNVDSPKHSIIHSTNEFTDNWHYFSIIKDDDKHTLSLYVDGELATSENNITDPILYITGSMLNIGGASNGSDPLFDVLKVENRDIDGGVSEFAMFDIALDENDVKSLYISKFSSNDAMEWVIDNGNKHFVEDIQKVFKFKKPGIKSQFFNIVIKNLDLSDEEKIVYERYIQSKIGELVPANTKMVKLIWR